MKKIPSKLEKRLQKRKDANSFRKLLPFSEGIDFFSNDYLGFSRSEEIFKAAEELLKTSVLRNGSTGSRLLSGNHSLFEKTEEQIAQFHNTPAALIFNSGYDANIGFFSAVPQKDDIIIYDELAHASIRDGLKMSLARNYNFKHNDLGDLEAKLKRLLEKNPSSDVYMVTESVFSMDGDSPDLMGLTELADKYNSYLIVDEAHALGVFGENGRGLVQQLNLESRVFARIVTYGKALGVHGSAIIGSSELEDYLVNFCRSFIYTTALSPHSVAGIYSAYRLLEKDTEQLKRLRDNIRFFREEIKNNNLENLFTDSKSAIQVCLISGNHSVKKVARDLQEDGYKVKAILAPTVPAGKERLRFCLHSYNSSREISEVLKVLSNFVSNNK
ncbi:aminotransferase class I/II-fold pyridoxal phosphate-dependent enzyme [Christiangramia sabulilitoris]|uniref:Pyridoxal phosphate-dependent aminotransferase family protein n=1 Tax=Christiangramia sabulilitoris TaxID=2583991 RepID=A0A550I0E0_9FLAO|nr:pyridoxal phosphate-dependent aminotransferase family protein [Christiangramia sabulilitoris]TRO64449.1 pyridoxal phosphate-dependent aminotransferase family protein [Christiangramia sabulilitoris]